MGHLIPAGTGFPGHRDLKIINLGEQYTGDAKDTDTEPAVG